MPDKIGFLLMFLFVACVNNSKKGKSVDSSYVATQGIQNAAKSIDTITNDKRGIQSIFDSLKDYDFYRFENDTLIQSAYVRYMSPRKIRFLVKTKNKKSSNTCEYSDSAKMASGEGTGEGSDELNNDELYGVYEYFTNRKAFLTIDIEFRRGKRMTVFTKADTGFCKLDCPLSSKGTLRRKSLSKQKQRNPTW